jgi:Restriction Endonuclease associating with ARP
VSSERRAVESALTRRLQEQLGPVRSAYFVGDKHTRRFTDNVLPTFPAWQIEELYAQLKAGGGSELSANKNGKRRAHAPYSSAALAFNVFGRWLGDEQSLTVCGLDGFTDRLAIESKQKISYGGGTANLDVLLGRPGTKVGVECKLAEHADLHGPVTWDAVYQEPRMGQLLDAKWRRLMDASIEERWQPRRLGVEQLIKHVLALRSQYPDEETHLVYVFWEPANASEHRWVREHREEVQKLQEYVDGSEIQLHHSTYWEVMDEWQGLPDPPYWLYEHLTAARARYNVEVPAAS